MVAAVGIASVSYVGTIQGCAGDDPSEESPEGALQAENETEGLAESQQALSLDRQVATQASAATVQVSAAVLKYGGIPGSGNLMAPDGPGGGGGVIIKVPLPVGNLMVSPVGDPIVGAEIGQAIELERR